MARLTDTSPEAEQVLRESYRRMSFAQKWQRMGALYRTARTMHAAGVRARDPQATPETIRRAWRLAMLGEALAGMVQEKEMPVNADELKVLQEVLAVFDRLNVPFALGGSWASSILGKMRFTRDADVTVEPFPGKEAQFASSFSGDYYVSLSAVQEAVQRRASFNLIYLPYSFKIDVFVRKDHPFHESLMARRRPYTLPDAPDQTLTLVTPEDIILLKLEWFRLGGETSERQWNDVLGVLEMQGERLDQTYLDHWAGQLRVKDLLDRARQESAA